MDPLRTAGQLASIRGSALLGDQQGVQDGLMAMHEDFRKAIKLADPARRVDREAAREALRGMEGLASAVWIDHENLFVLVDRNELRTQAVIDDVCIRLEPLGDTLGVVVNLQDLAIRQRLGSTAHHPRWAYAVKFQPRKEVSELLSIVPSVGRTGVVTPIAMLRPVNIGGVTVSRANLHNIDGVHQSVRAVALLFILAMSAMAVYAVVLAGDRR